MPHGLPADLRAALQRLLEGVSRNDLARRASAISEHYRGGGTSAVVSTKADALAYLVSRLPATFAAVDAVLTEVRARAVGFAPKSVLDVGAGPGTASWAALAAWPEIETVAMLDGNRHLLDLGAELGAEIPALRTSERRLGDIVRSDRDLPSADLVVAGFALAELAEARAPELVSTLWRACRGVLVLVEPGTPAGFARVRAARATLIAAGAEMLAPCPHRNDCPIVSPDWCHFAVRLPRLRDHMIAKGAVVPFEDEKFSYVAFARDRGARAAAARILSRPRLTKAELGLRLCTEAGIVEETVPRRDRGAFARLRHARWGDAVDVALP